MRVALISDLHGNMVALRAVLQDIERRPVDRIVCLGDLATLGPAPDLPHAEYATVEAAGGAASVTLHRVPLDRAALLRQTQGWDNPLRDYLVGQYER